MKMSVEQRCTSRWIRRGLSLAALACTLASSAGAIAAPSAGDHGGPATASAAQNGASLDRVPADADRAGNAGVMRTAPLRFGPLVGLGFPRPLAIEGFARISDFVGVGVEYSFLPRVDLFGASTSFKAVAADLRVFPFKGSFFIGLRAGRQWLDATATATLAINGMSSELTESMDASTWFLNPRIGFLHRFESGITLGIDAGIQLPIAPSFTRAGPATSAGLTSDTDRTLASVAGALGNDVTPTVDLLRVGFLF